MNNITATVATLGEPLARKIIDITGIDRLAWVPWARVRAEAIGSLRPIFRGTRIEWTVAGHSISVQFEAVGPASGEVLVRAIVSAVSLGTERANFNGEPNASVQFPYYPGYSLVGEIVKIGKDVTNLEPGQLVAARARHASFAVVSEDSAIPLPKGVLPEEGAFFTLGVIALNAIWHGRMHPGERTAVFGRGPIGQLCCQLVNALGASDVVSIAPSRRHQVPSLQHFAHRIIATNEEHEDVLHTVQADVTYEASGHPSAIHDAVRATRDGGRVVLLGSPRGITADFDFGELADRNITMLGAHISSMPQNDSAEPHNFRQASIRFLSLLDEKALDVGSLINVEVNPWEAGLFYRNLGRSGSDWVGALFRWDYLDDTERMKRVFYWTRPDLNSLRSRMIHMPLEKSAIKPEPSELQVRPVSRTRTGTLGKQQTLGIAVIGCGEHGLGAILEIQRTELTTLVVVMDSDEKLARSVGERFDVPWTTDYEAVISDDTVDIVSIFTPHHLHGEQAISAANAGKHLIVAKPLAHNLESAARIVRTAHEAGVQLSTELQARYNAPVVKAKQLMDAGALGTILGAHLTYHRYKTGSYYQNGLPGNAPNWRGRWETAGGGVLIMNAIHNLDWLFYLSGMKVQEVSARYATLGSDVEVEDSIVMWITLENGALATVNASTCVPGFAENYSLTEWRLWGTDGHLSLTRPYQFYSSRLIDGKYPERWHPVESVSGLLSARAEYLHRFALAVLKEENPEITGEDGLRLQAVIEAAYRSSREGCPVRVEYPEL